MVSIMNRLWACMLALPEPKYIIVAWFATLKQYYIMVVMNDYRGLRC